MVGVGVGVAVVVGVGVVVGVAVGVGVAVVVGVGVAVGVGVVVGVGVAVGVVVGRCNVTAHKIKCFNAECKGVLFSVNDATARLAAHFGRENYVCDTCGDRFSIRPEEYAAKLQPGTGGAR